MQSLTRIRFTGKQLALASIGVALGTATIITLADQAIHRYRVQQANGEWCIQFTPTGQSETRYGQACGF